jgi:hypothetical protein
MRYRHAQTYPCPLCRMPDSCTHMAWECPDREALRISRHNVACQLVHAAIRRTGKGGGALHSASCLILVMADTCVQPMTTGDSIVSPSPTSEDAIPSPTTGAIPHDWCAPLPTTEETHRRRNTDVSLYPNPTLYSISDTHPGHRPSYPAYIGLYTRCGPDVFHTPSCKGFLSFFSSARYGS